MKLVRIIDTTKYGYKENSITPHTSHLLKVGISIERLVLFLTSTYPSSPISDFLGCFLLSQPESSSRILVIITKRQYIDNHRQDKTIRGF